MQLSAFRRTLAVGAVWASAVGGLLATSSPASGQEGVQPGLGNAYAQGIKVDPRTGSLSIGLTYGMSLAGHQNTVALAEARSLDLGIIGVLLAGEGCDGSDPTLPKDQQPQPTVMRSTDEGAGEVRKENELGVDKEVLATTDPIARAVATTSAIGEPGVLQISASQSRTESGLIDGARVARAVTELGRVSLAGGAVVLKGLKWEASYQTAPEELAAGSFSLGGIEIAGEDVPFPEDDPFAGLEQANEVLNPLGFQIVPPKVRNEAGIQFVDPLRIGVIPSDTRESVLGPVLNAAQPVREQLFDAIMEISCKNGTYLTVLDIVLGALTGAGSLNVELGGVTATSDDIELSSFLGGAGGGGTLPPLDQTGGLSTPGAGTGSSSSGSSVDTGSLSTPSTVAASPGGAGTPAGDAGADEVALDDAQPASALTGSRGGALAGVGLGGLALLVALAAADRAKMRRAQRSILLEVN